MAPKIKKEPEVLLQKSQSSCTIKRDPKGITSFEIKAYADTLEEAVKKAEKEFRGLDKNH